MGYQGGRPRHPRSRHSELATSTRRCVRDWRVSVGGNFLRLGGAGFRVFVTSTGCVLGGLVRGEGGAWLGHVVFE